MGSAAGLGLLAAACGGNSGRGGSASNELQQWYHAYGEDGVQDAVNRYAAAYPGGKVHVQWNPGDYDSKIVTALQNNSVPDVFEAQAKVNMVRAGQVVALDDVIGAAKDDFLPSALATATVDGKVYGIPESLDTQVLFYRKSWLAQAGVQPPQTVDELIDAAQKLNVNGHKGLFVGNDGGVVLLGPLLWSAGLDYLHKEGKGYTAGFDDPTAAQVFGKLHDMNANGSLLLGAPADWSDPSAFTSGEVAMQWSGLWNIPAVTAKLHDDFGVLPFPRFNNNGKGSVPIGAYGSMINAKSTRIEEDKKFVKWLWVDQTDKQLEFATKYGFHIPVRKSLIAKATTLKTGPAADAARYVQENSFLVGGPNWTPTMDTTLKDALSKIIKNGGDGSAVLRPAVSSVNQELKRLFG
jgi:multiple sugar transport system substrate-binding protein